MNIPKRPRSTRAFLVIATLVLGIFGLSACEPIEVEAFNAIHGTSLSVQQASNGCIEFEAVHGPGSCDQFVRFLNGLKKIGYIDFPSCKEAIDHFFGGDWDYQRALRVGRRESGPDYKPNLEDYAHSGHLGCAQLSEELRAQWLKGPPDDPFFNVQAWRDITRSATPENVAGWCHWDIVNYCAPGGEWG